MTILFNDQLIARDEARVDVEDRGYQFGDGVYEVIRVYGGHPFCLEEHLDRLERSAREIRMPLPYSREKTEHLLLQLIEADHLKEGYLYVQITRGVAPRDHAFPSKSEPVLTAYAVESQRPTDLMKNGIRAITQEDIRWLRCDIKSLNLLGAVLAKQAAVDAGAQEAILHRNGTVTEGSATNVFIVKDNTLWTHPANHLILHGITRAVTLKLAEKEGIPVREEAFSLEDLRSADEVFITSTTKEIVPVVAVDGIPVGTGQPGLVTRKLQQAFEQKIGVSV
ncbi:D-amino-acid transaminase [Polycladomyces sp. WAk]|uniref:D-alanine aminotransferase n=1 Tax=Polycladomyces zharkentensis TaxID=2807616 RepID=A0ABS2WK40_9BACL|nr:D-amino-acid transaminase [Polycladomyces sp. WAk]MBN2909894.1 D-amino-acid transaminase [Polycladomyces sp. WAk]